MSLFLPVFLFVVAMVSILFCAAVHTLRETIVDELSKNREVLKRIEQINEIRKQQIDKLYEDFESEDADEFFSQN